MKSIAGIYGDIQGRTFEFLHFYVKIILREEGVDLNSRKHLLFALKTSDLESVKSAWSGIRYSAFEKGMEYVKNHTPFLFTDDTILTIATMEVLIQKGRYASESDFKLAYHTWANKYSESGFGGSFKKWIKTPLHQALPYNSFGNGSAMRVGPIGYFAQTEQHLRDLVRQSSICTHNNPEGIRGALAVADVINMASVSNLDKWDIKSKIQDKYFYDLTRAYAEIQPQYGFEVSCQRSVPEAIICFLESENTEDAIGLAIGLGGDADTQAMMAGSMAEAFYDDVSKQMIETVQASLPEEMLLVIERFNGGNC